TLAQPEKAEGLGAVRRLTTTQAQLHLTVEVRPAIPEEKYQVSLTQQVKEKRKEIPGTTPTSGPCKIERDINLEVGENLIELVAWNVDRARQGQEQSRLLLEVNFRPEKPPLEILLRSVVPMTGGQEKVLPIESGRVLTTHFPRVRIEGEI